MSDPRLLVIPQRLSGIRRIVAVMSSKGGVGKTIISTMLSLIASQMGLKTGLLDLDFTNPSTHIVLGIDPLKLEIKEEKGVIPPTIDGVEYMSIALFSGDNPLPLRGNAVDDAFREILAITRWGRLDLLVIDTPPGMSDIHLNLLSYLGEKTEILIIATPSPLAVKSVERLITLLLEGNYKVIGLIENMGYKPTLKELCIKTGIRYMGLIPYIENIDEKIGDTNMLLNLKALVEPLKNIVELIQ